ncbi:YggN family protein [Aliiglaciecola sp. LCG003]|uniref:YggN family protein n=1 Tax=Aliiglaciecola sp. LCG003 TaxID=3053655 RepID=UPI002572D42C|nr:YggN family protein [Aliiglaciecola sp. LCG003]WJG10377.1 YggN family protein [Aliiglaciecola sp. LCG003]
MRFVLLLCSLLYSLQSVADLKCDVDLKYGLVVNDRQIRIIDQSRTLYQINGTKQLIVLGNVVELDDAQQRDLEELASGIHYVVPKMIILATDGVELAVDTVEHVYKGLVGTDHQSYEKLQSSLQRVQRRVKEKFIHANENFYMGPGRLENVDDLVDREIEEQIEQAISTSVGGVLSAIGGLTDGASEETEQKMEDLSQRIEQMGLDIDLQVGPKALTLRKKARWFCNKMHLLDKTEDRLRDAVPQLRDINVITTSNSELLEVK